MGKYRENDRVFIPSFESWGTVKGFNGQMVVIFVDRFAQDRQLAESAVDWSDWRDGAAPSARGRIA